MTYYKGKEVGQFDWEQNKTLSLVVVNRVLAEIRDAVLRDLNETQTTAEKAGGRYLLEKPLTPTQVMDIVNKHVARLQALEPAPAKEIESSE